MINQSTPHDIEKQIEHEIRKIKYTIEELNKLKIEKFTHRNNLYYAKFNICDNICHPIEYYKKSLEIDSLDNMIIEITRIIDLERAKLIKQKEYLRINKRQLDEYDDHI